MRRIATPFILSSLMLVLLLGGASAQAAPSCPTLGDPSREISFSGATGQNTRPFDLAAGAYVVRWSGAMKGQFGGNLIMSLNRADGQILGGGGIVNTITNREQPTASGETFLYNVKAGQHYVDVLGQNDWTVSISPL